MNRPARPQVTATVGGKAPSQLGIDALLDFQMEVTLDGETLTAAEIKQLLAAVRRPGVDPRQVGRGRPRAADAGRSSSFEAIERRAADRGPVVRRGDAPAGRRRHRRRRGRRRRPTPTGAQIVAGPVARRDARGPAQSGRRAAHVDPGRSLHGTLRPYQQAGVHWLHLLTQLGLGACLADDMGLGKTIQVLSLLLVLKQRGGGRAASRACWSRRLRCSPTGPRRSPASRRACKAVVVASFGNAGRELQAANRRDRWRDADLVITSYGYLARAPWLARDVVAAGGARRGAGDQESRRQADPGGQGAARPMPASR